MLASRFCRVVLLSGFVLLGFTCALAAQDPSPDLRVAQIELLPTVAAGGEPVTATVIVERSGPPLAQDADVDITWRRRDREEPCGARVGIFPAGDGALALQYVVVIPTDGLTPGAYEVIATADPRNLLAEASEANNRLTASLEILAPRPELHPVRAEISPAPPLLWGETATIAAGVMNTGQASAGPFHISFAAFPVYCVDERTGERWSVAPSQTPNARGLYSWTFTPDDGSRSPQVVGLAALATALPTDSWIVFDERQVAGLEQGSRVDLGAALATGFPLRQLLTTSGSRDGAVGASSTSMCRA